MTPLNRSEYLPLALWAYRTTKHGATRATPFSLVYGVKALLPAEIEVSSARMMLEQKGNREGELEELEDKRDAAIKRMREYQRKLMLAYDKHVRPKMFIEGEMVMKAMDAVMRK